MQFGEKGRMKEVSMGEEKKSVKGSQLFLTNVLRIVTTVDSAKGKPIITKSWRGRPAEETI